MENNKTLSIIALVAIIAIVGIVVAFAVMSRGNVQTTANGFYVTTSNSADTTNSAGMMRALCSGSEIPLFIECMEDCNKATGGRNNIGCIGDCGKVC